MKNITLSSLLNLAGSVAINSEPHKYHSEVFEKDQVHFENRNTSEVFWLYLNQNPLQYLNGEFEFKVPYTDQTVWIEFFEHNLITPENLQI